MSWLDSYPELVGVRLNMVTNGQSELIGELDSSRSMSNSTDRELIVHLRTISDVYVTGGNTARREGYKTPEKGQLAVISRSKPSNLGQIWINPPSDESVTAWSVAELRRLGFSKILLEVGPSLARQFLQGNLVDEFCLTVTNGNLASATRVLQELGAKLFLADSIEVDGTLFTRWRRGNE